MESIIGALIIVGIIAWAFYGILTQTEDKTPGKVKFSTYERHARRDTFL